MEFNEPRAPSVLMVCLGNICRSPLAEAALRHHAAKRGLDIVVDSAGTGDWHIGHSPDPRAQDVALRLGGINIASLQARQVSPEDFHRYDHIVAMDAANLRHLTAIMPADSRAKLSLLLKHLPGSAGESVADPYYGDADDFEACWRQVDAASAKLAETL